MSIARPGGDYRASPIEEVTVAVKAQDEFGLKDLDLHYSVNGGPEKTVRLLKQPGDKQASGSSVLALEDFKLVPGDLVSVYATAKDARAESHTDMLFIQVDPFEREFSQSQQAGGGGGGGGGGGQRDDPSEISRREKEIDRRDVQAAERQEGDREAGGRDREVPLRGAGHAAQPVAVARRPARGARADAREQGVQRVSAGDDRGGRGDDARPRRSSSSRSGRTRFPSEQKALQHLLRAEATFRQIEVAFGARRRRRRRRRRRPRSREPVRPRARHREEPVRDAADARRRPTSARRTSTTR